VNRFSCEEEWSCACIFTTGH